MISTRLRALPPPSEDDANGAAATGFKQAAIPIDGGSNGVVPAAGHGSNASTALQNGETPAPPAKGWAGVPHRWRLVAMMAVSGRGG